MYGQKQKMPLYAVRKISSGVRYWPPRMFKSAEALRMALRAIASYRLRAALTMLGITIGIFAITLTFTLVDSLQYSVTQNLSQLGNTVLYVHNWPWKDNSEDWQKYFQRPKMSFEDFRALKERLQRVSAVSLDATQHGQTARWRGLSVENVPVKGITQDYNVVQPLALSAGRYFLPVETEGGRPVCLVGSRLAQNLFQGQNPLGQVITLGGMRLTVVGLLERQGSNIFGQSQDDNLLIPFEQFAQHFDLRRRNIDRVVAVRALTPEDVPWVESDIIGILRQVRGLRPGVEDNFSINKQETLMDQIGQIFSALNVGGLFISIFALLVGGFGIANIMFVAVKERTKEIGIQKALGSTRLFILQQFLLEAVVLCLLGALAGLGLLGLAVLAAGAVIAGSDMGLELIVSARSIGVGMLFAVVTGILSGLLPAIFAARLDPVEAIRSGG